MILLDVHITGYFNFLKAKLNPKCHFLLLLGSHHILHVSRIMVKTRNLTTCSFLKVF